MHFEDQFIGKKVVITGAAGIFGTWIAQAFAAQGAKLCLSDIRGNELRAMAEDPLLSDTELLFHTSDLTQETSIVELAALVEKEWSSADILINNAGIYQRHHLMEMSAQAWNHSIGVNVTAPFLLTQLLAKQMIKDGKPGSIINISSGAALSNQIGGGHYSTGKAALSMLTRSFALELAPYQIRVNAVAPGFAPGSEVSELSEDYVNNLLTQIPLGRTSGPQDAPTAILYLCSESASFITGSTLTVDGGRTAGTFKAPKLQAGKQA
ncbi:SDR family oxidoreductase [Paenibacillus sp. WQ 127069]|uniref:SDR family oxidoreductase n=1 Tax=Paenibacillus baimaensis TaxID=2982185 RepID=A0ABT2U8E9_9BACL|nr:SDR family oxidoreductase [Paenibacillus sp. WQ 127069]MCU6790904.1 SDR family oxidoreductase [Paenibacillus sp. WQ 127069]